MSDGSSAKVIDLADHRIGRERGWAVLSLVCDQCGYQCVSVGPNTGRREGFECAGCGAMTMREAPPAPA